MKQDAVDIRLDELPDNGSPLRRFRRWNIGHNFIGTYVIWGIVAVALSAWLF